MATIRETISIAEHVDDVIKACVRSMYAISFLRSHTWHVRTTTAAGLKAWWGFSTSADCLRFETFLCRAARSGLWESVTTAEELS